MAAVTALTMKKNILIFCVVVALLTALGLALFAPYVPQTQSLEVFSPKGNSHAQYTVHVGAWQWIRERWFTRRLFVYSRPLAARLLPAQAGRLKWFLCCSSFL